MAGYVIVNQEIHDAVVFAEYIEKIVAVTDAHGGKYLVRGGASEVTDGDWDPGRVVIIEFESPDRAREFVTSPEYQELREIRLRSTNTRVVIVEGV